MNRIIISIDAMGGDHGISTTVPASFDILAKYPNVELILVGKKEILESAINEADKPDLAKRITIQHASEEVFMGELPSKALRTKKDSSMRVAINLVKEDKADACVSAGNTGALVATARFVLKTLPGISRPAITTLFPTTIPGVVTNILDLGANVDLGVDYLVQLAAMGSVLSKIVDGIDNPKVALLNIGSEEVKGNDKIRKAANILSQNIHINYIGFVEGDDLFKGKVDVVVCDGFTGNIVLKTIEGALKLVVFYAKRNMLRNIFTKITTLLAFPMLRKLQKDIDPNRYNGATLIGLRGVVIKSHGGANAAAFASALEKAVLEVEKQVPKRIHDELARILQKNNKKD